MLIEAEDVHWLADPESLEAILKAYDMRSRKSRRTKRWDRRPLGIDFNKFKNVSRR
jgi:hypothetical protein